jgi:hypothetical protein
MKGLDSQWAYSQKHLNRIPLIIFSSVILFISSCNKNCEIELAQNDFLIFGHFYGECLGEGCVETFKLTNNKLFEDLNDNYSGTDFDFIELENDTFEQVEDLIDYFPNQLLSEIETTLGCPDCADQGGLLIQYSENGTLQSWRIDQSQSSVPDYLHEFMDKVNEKIYLINN